MRTASGTISTSAVPGALFTYASGIGSADEIAGSYADASFKSHGFVRAKDGTITTIDPLGSKGTNMGGINPDGMITGWYSDANSTVHGFFVRSK